uniref:Uncharacterized protein n=1 Tax=Cannabis sativa TaxID=3483 RepID=A0A803PYY3_CANSA
MVLTQTQSCLHYNNPKNGDVDSNAKTRDVEDPTEVTSRHKKDQTNKDSIPEDYMDEGNKSEETDSVDPEDNYQDMPIDDDAKKEGNPDESDPVVTVAQKLRETEDKFLSQGQFSLPVHKEMSRTEAVIKALTATRKTNHDAPKDNTTRKVDPKNPRTYDPHKDKGKRKVGETSKKAAQTK